MKTFKKYIIITTLILGLLCSLFSSFFAFIAFAFGPIIFENWKITCLFVGIFSFFAFIFNGIKEIFKEI